MPGYRRFDRFIRRDNKRLMALGTPGPLAHVRRRDRKGRAAVGAPCPEFLLAVRAHGHLPPRRFWKTNIVRPIVILSPLCRRSRLTGRPLMETGRSL